MGLTQDIGEFVAAARFDKLPDGVVPIVATAFTDCVGVMLAGSQTCGAAGVSDDWPLAEMYSHARTLHLVDGPDEVHLQQIARRELRQYESLRV